MMFSVKWVFGLVNRIVHTVLWPKKVMSSREHSFFLIVASNALKNVCTAALVCTFMFALFWNRPSATCGIQLSLAYGLLCLFFFFLAVG